jgi:hypothetical protein
MSPRKSAMTDMLDQLADLVIAEYNRGEHKGDVMHDARRELRGILTDEQFAYVALRAFVFTHQP